MTFSELTNLTVAVTGASHPARKSIEELRPDEKQAVLDQLEAMVEQERRDVDLTGLSAVSDTARTLTLEIDPFYHRARSRTMATLAALMNPTGYRDYGGGYTAPRIESGVTIPDHSQQRIAAAQAKRERKARLKAGN